MTQFGLRGDNLDIAALTNDSIDVQTGLFQMTMDGSVSQDYEKADITWGFTIEGIRYEEYNFRRFFGSGSLKKRKLLANLDVTTSGEENVRANTTIENVFDSETPWKFGLWLDSFNAKYGQKMFHKQILESTSPVMERVLSYQRLPGILL